MKGQRSRSAQIKLLALGNEHLCVMLTQPAATVASAWARSACKRRGWRCRWSPRWSTGQRSSPRSPAPGSGAGCSRTGWSGRPWGAPGQRGCHSFQPGEGQGHNVTLDNHNFGQIVPVFCRARIFWVARSKVKFMKHFRPYIKNELRLTEVWCHFAPNPIKQSEVMSTREGH